MAAAAVMVEEVAAASVEVEVVRMMLRQDVEAKERYVVVEDRRCGNLKYESCRCT